MIYGKVPPLRRLRPFSLIAGLMAHWYQDQQSQQQYLCSLCHSRYLHSARISTGGSNG